MKISSLCSITLANTGLMTEPCGVPISLLKNLPSSLKPAFSALCIRSVNALSWIRSFSVAISILWLKESKHALMSPSINQFTEVNVFFTCLSAECTPFPGRNPCEFVLNVGS